MNREILFRAKAINRDERYETRTRYKNGDWVYGLVSRLGSEKYDIPMEMTNTDGISGIDVDRKTVGQYTGLCDKNGKKIFEGDICWFYGGNYYSGLWEQNAIVAITDMTDDEQTHYLNNAEYCEVIGNIYDSPELMEATK